MSGSHGFLAPPTTVSSGHGGSDGSWWRWTQGRNGSSAASSGGATTTDSVRAATTLGLGSASTTTRTSSKAGLESWESTNPQWQKRWTTTVHNSPSESRDDAGSTNGSNFARGAPPAAAVPTFFASSTAQLRASARSTLVARRKGGSSSSSSGQAMRSSTKTAAATTTSTRKLGGDPFLTTSSGRTDSKVSWGQTTTMVPQEERPYLASTSTSTSKRKFGRKDKRTARTSSVPTSMSGFLSVEDVVMVDPPCVDVFPAFRGKASTTTTSTASAVGAAMPTTTTAVSPLGFGNPDPLVTCARAVLEDCFRQRCLDSSNLRKRTLEGYAKCDRASKDTTVNGFATKPSEFSLSGCSSSSDDELSQLSSLDFAQNGVDKADCKTSSEELYRQLMLCDYDLSTSPDFECFSPLFEEKGLPVEIRYQLPLALGTANETDKECTICQFRYGIGDHIVTLPCQHFFHACCVDKWLWNHTSCPLCRTEVSLESNVSASTTKHRFNECPQLDQETMRRKMRSSSHSVGFRPVIPAKLEVDQLDTHLTNLAIDGDEDEDDTEANALTYLVCPKPQRSHPKQSH